MMGGKLISYLLVLDYLFPTCQVSEKAYNSPDCCAKWPLPFPCSLYFSVSLALWLTLNRMLSHTYCQWSLDDSRSLVLLFLLLSHPQSIQYYSVFFLQEDEGDRVLKNGYQHMWWAFRRLLVVTYSNCPPSCVDVGDSQSIEPWAVRISVQPQEAEGVAVAGGRRVEIRHNKAISSVILFTW